MHSLDRTYGVRRVLIIMLGRSRVTIDPRIPTMPRRIVPFGLNRRQRFVSKLRGVRRICAGRVG